MAQTHAPTRRLITSLGTTNYSETTYTFGEFGGLDTPFTGHALATLLDVDEIYVIATHAALEKNKQGLDAAFQSTGCPEAHYEIIPEGGSAQELWAQFDVLIKALNAGSNAEVWFDITFGYRIMQFLAATAISYVRAIHDEPGTHHVVYGAYVRDQEITPLWDVTPAVEVVDWAQALQIFLKTGRAAQLRTLSEPLGRSLRKQWAMTGRQGEPPSIAKLAERFEQFSQDFATVRTGSLLLNTAHNTKSKQGSAAELAHFIEQARDEVNEHLPPLAVVLERIAEMLDGLSAERLDSQEGIAALARLAALYQQTERYAEAAATVREAHVTRHATPEAAAPGTAAYDGDARHEAEQQWFRAEPDEARQIANARNDIEHAGFNKTPSGAGRLIEQISALVNELEHSPFVGPAEGMTSHTFVNLSNHPSPEWSDTQRQAALACSPDLTQIIDVPFPAVDPDTDETQIINLVNNLCESIPEGTSHAMVSGEYTLTFALVRALQRRGITCVAATTRREVFVDKASGDTLRRFTFARFREYAR